MLVIRQRRLVVFIFIILIIITVIGIRGYLIIGESSRYDNDERKYQAELFLYTAVLSDAVCLLCVLFILQGNKNIIRQLDKLIELSHAHVTYSTKGLEKLGDIGGKIKELCHTIDDLNERQALKISTQSSLITRLLSLIPSPIIVTDTAGKVTGVSGAYGKSFAYEKEHEAIHSIGDILPSFDFRSIIDYHTENPDENPFVINGTITVHTISNKKGDASQFLILPSGTLTIPPDKPVKKKYGKPGGFLRRIFGKKKQIG
ncbi:MAG: hypothetical protein JW881_07115 [Spirochaetales bacterium]|nr:hypothetical protein [Spirochaetales bacterium]